MGARIRARAAREAAIKAPAIIVVGDVAALHDEIGWLSDRPLFGRSVAVIGRSMEQNFRIATDLGYLKYEPSMIVAKDSSHCIQLDAPGLVVEAVRSVVDQARIK